MSTLDRYKSIINDDGSLTSDEEHLSILRDAMHALKNVANLGNECENLNLRVRYLEQALQHIQSACGLPDAAEGCRLILKLAEAALQERKE